MYSDDLSRVCEAVGEEWYTEFIGIDIDGVETNAPETVDVDDMTYPYLRLALMFLADRQDILTYNDV